jgi:zona occludens toxin (predicted ATPase)
MATSSFNQKIYFLFGLVLAAIGAVGWWIDGIPKKATAQVTAKNIASNQNNHRATIQEIQAMVATRPNDVSAFIVRYATTERIEALYRSPELLDLPNNVRANGLIFAGLGSSLLKFEKPSDILSKIATWFPVELTMARSDPDDRFGNG